MNSTLDSYTDKQLAAELRRLIQEAQQVLELMATRNIQIYQMKPLGGVVKFGLPAVKDLRIQKVEHTVL